MAGASRVRRRTLMQDDDPTAPLDFRLVPAALALWAGCLTALWGGVGPAFSCAIVAVATTAALWWFGAGGWRRGASVGLLGLAAGALVCGFQITRATDSPLWAAAENSAFADVRITVDGDPQPLSGAGGVLRHRISGTVEEARFGGTTRPADLPVTLYCDDPGWADVVPGQQVSTRGRLGIDVFQSWPTLSMNCSSPPVEVEAAPWWQRSGTALRQQFVAVASTVGGEAAGLLPGIVLGDRSGISPALTQDAKITGLTHLLAVSGSHFVVLCGAVLVLLRRAGPRVAAAGGLLFATALVVVVRPSPSVLRAAVMGGLTLGALLLGRQRSMVPALATAVLVLLLIDPALAVQAGFALSVQATAAIVLVAPKVSEALQDRGWPAGWADLLVVPAVAQLGTMPVIAAISGTVSVWALPANILVAAAVPAALILGAVAALLSPVWTAGAALLAQAAAPAAEWIAFCAHWVAGWPAAVIAWPATGTGVALLAALCVAIPVGLRFRRFRVVVLAVVATAAVILLPGRVLSGGWPPPGWLAVGCEVGQGDGFVVATGRPGEAVVIDTGPEPSVMDRCLTRLGITEVPLLVLSHLHADHIDGLAGVIRHRRTGQIAVGPGRDPAAAWSHLIDDAGAAEIPVTAMDLGTHLTVGQLSVTVIGPDRTRVSSYAGPNDQSVVLMIDAGGFRMLFAGDIEDDAQHALVESGIPLRADVLKLPHHGSAKLLPEFMAAVDPTVVMIGVGADNDFGHPTGYALQLVHDVGVQLILRTDTDGDIGVTIVDGVLGTATRGAAPIQPRRVPSTLRRRRKPPQRRSAAPAADGVPLRTWGSGPAPPAPGPVRGPVGRPVPAPAAGVRSARPPRRGPPQGFPGRSPGPRPGPDAAVSA